MANGTEKLAKDWKKHAGQILGEHPNWNAAQVRRQLIVILGEVKTPGISAIQKIMPDLKKGLQDIQEKGLDNPWHLGTLQKYPLPVEAIKRIWKINKGLAKKRLNPVTIREARWVACLHSLLKKDDFTLWCVSVIYGAYEMVCDITNTDVNTRDLDEALSQGVPQLGELLVRTPMLYNALNAALWHRDGVTTTADYLKYLKSKEKEGEK